MNSNTLSRVNVIPLALFFAEQQHCTALKRSKCPETITEFTEIETTRRKAVKTN